MNYRAALAPVERVESPQLAVNELFCSIQGEGRWIGRPALFVRLNYCNLGCSWCDTKFTWQSGTIEASQLLTPEQLAWQADQLRQSMSTAEATHVIFTGGEPLLQMEKLPTVIEAFQCIGYRFFEVETNGLFLPSPELIEQISWWNCSPKLTNNGLPIEKNRNLAVLTALASTGRSDFKFVVSSPADLDEIATAYAPHLPKERIFLMAEGVSLAGQIAAFPWLSREAWNRGWQYTPRLQILLWGNARKK